MIKVLNRELLIPNNERYLGTEYDTNSAVRIFQLDRVCSDGVDIADLLFKLDLKYPEDRTIYTLTTTNTITSGTIYVNKVSFLKQKKTVGSYQFDYDGTNWSLNNTTVTLSDYGIKIVSGTPASGNYIKVTLATTTEQYDVVNLTKEVTDDQIKLQWAVTENQLAVPGTVFIQIRALNDDADVKWSSFQSAMFVEDAINAGTHINSISELEELELALEAQMDNVYTKTETNTLLAGKVDTETGKGLSTNDYTTAEKTKLAGIAEGAEANVQSDFDQSDSSADDYIKNKPTSLSDFTDDLGSNPTHTHPAVRYDQSQALTEAQKLQARNNIGAGSATGGDMLAATYDPNAHATDIFAYADSVASNKVDKVTGKGLSTNDYDATEKQKVTDAYADKHTHTNKSVLDGIDSSDVSSWDAKAEVVKQTSINLTSTWSGSASPYSQTITISGADANTKVDLQPSATILAQLIDDGVIALFVENNSGTLTCYAVGKAPTVAINNLQVTYYEVTSV